MQLISAHDGKLLRLNGTHVRGGAQDGFITGLPLLDALLPGQRFARGTVHELLTEPGNGLASFFAMVIARAAMREQDKVQSAECRVQNEKAAESSQFSISNFQFSIFNSSSLIWSDPFHQLYPPALGAHGIPLNRLLLLRPRDLEEQTWAVAECLRCRGVGAVVAAPADLSRTEARRLQLAAEQGGGVGLLLRTTRSATPYAAATRWAVRPPPGPRTVQRLEIPTLYGPRRRPG